MKGPPLIPLSGSGFQARRIRYATRGLDLVRGQGVTRMDEHVVASGRELV